MVINVTHNLDKEFLQKYDKIICMESGKIVGIGDYNALYDKKLYFHRLCKDYKNEQSRMII